MKRIFIFSIATLIFAAVSYVVRVVHEVGTRAADFCMSPFRADYGNAFQIVERFLLSSYRLISMLKPEYDASLDTAGQNFDRNSRLRLAY